MWIKGTLFKKVSIKKVIQTFIIIHGNVLRVLSKFNLRYIRINKSKPNLAINLVIKM